MGIPGQTFTINDPGLGVVEPSDTIPLVLGICESGTAATMYTYSSVNDMYAAHGEGPAPEHAASELAEAGGPIRLMRIAESAAGSIGAFTQSGGGPAVSDNSSAPLDSYELVIKIITGGALGTAEMQYSLDDGRNYSATLTIPAGGSWSVPGTGIALTFAAGTYVVDETYSADTVNPIFTTTELAACATAISASDDQFSFIVLAGRIATAAAAQTLIAALDTHLATFESEFRFVSAICTGGDDNEATTKPAITNEDRKILICYGTADRNSAKPITGLITPKMPITVDVGTRACQAKLSEDLGRFASGNLGQIPGASLTHGVPISHDEYRTENMDASGFTTLRSYPGQPGYYITHGRIKCGVSSDFKYWQYARILDVALAIVYTQQLAVQNASVRTNADGTIDERDAAALETKVQSALDIALMEPVNAEGTKGHVSAVSYTVDRTNNVGSSNTVQTELKIRPLGYLKWITTQAGFALNA